MPERPSIIQFIKITPPFSLNKYWDESEPQAPSGLFQNMENYIPHKNYLETRLGITEFTFTTP
jgi:hypothetical protein